jgi:enamine deaminase RidA (YjgF/YER057c/UK114 family)
MKFFASLCLTLLIALASAPAAGIVKRVNQGRMAHAVVVEDSVLAHTAQFLPVNAEGQILHVGDARRQAAQVLTNLSLALSAAGSRLRDAVKLNVYAISPEAIKAAEAVIREHFKDTPAVALVTGKLAHPDALVAMDVVAVANASHKNPRCFVSPQLSSAGGVTHASVLPLGAKVYVSGQAEKGTLLEATRKTMESLSKTLVHLGLNDANIIQLKAFLTPMASVGEVQAELIRYFGDQAAPPMVFVEWNSTTPIEIELIAAGGRPKAQPAIEFITPPEMKPSPVYCRVTRVNRERLVYTSGLYGASSQNGKAEVTEIFDQLKSLLPAVGSDMTHLVKATYYVSTSEASNELNAQRPKYYDPERPPAASKALVPGVGMERKSITLDLIAVGN